MKKDVKNILIQSAVMNTKKKREKDNAVSNKEFV